MLNVPDLLAVNLENCNYAVDDPLLKMMFSLV